MVHSIEWLHNVSNTCTIFASVDNVKVVWFANSLPSYHGAADLKCHIFLHRFRHVQLLSVIIRFQVCQVTILFFVTKIIISRHFHCNIHV